MANPSVLDLTSDVDEPKKFTIDGEEYDLYSFDHLSPDIEAEVTATFARFQKLFFAMEKSKNDAAAVVQAKKLGNYRERIIARMTNVPLEVIKGLKPGKQGKLLNVIQEEIGAEAVAEAEEGDFADIEEAAVDGASGDE